jgi:hypothetical protein
MEEKSRIVADRFRAESWETFRFVPILQEQIPENLIKHAKLIVDHLAADDIAETFIELIETPHPESRWLLDTLAQYVGIRVLDAVATALMRNPLAVRNLSIIYPDDPWAEVSIPMASEQTRTPYEGYPASSFARPRERSLSRILRQLIGRGGNAKHIETPAFKTRSDTNHRVIGEDLDCLGDAGYHGEYVSFTKACNTALRRKVTPTKDSCIVATARNEGPYLLEWIAYHKSIGVQQIFLYSNDNDDGSDTLLRALADAGEIVWIKNNFRVGGVAQEKAYGHALSVLPDILDYRWAMIIDLDEFFVLNPDAYQNIDGFLHWHERNEVDAIAVNWVFLGPTKQKSWSPDPLAHRFTHQLGKGAANSHIKTIFRPKKFSHAWPHFPIVDHNRTFSYRDTTGRIHSPLKAPLGADHALTFSDHPSRDLACIYHYHFKSAEEFIYRQSQNRGDHPTTMTLSTARLSSKSIATFMEHFDPVSPLENEWMDKWHPAVAERMDKLRAIPAVSAAEHLVIKAFKQKLQTLKESLHHIDAIQELGETGQQFLRLALSNPDDVTN